MKRKSFFILVIALGLSFNVFSQMQYILKQAIIVNSGIFEMDDPADFVTVSSFNPIIGLSFVFDTIYTQSAQCVVVEDGFAFVAAQDSVIKYNLDTYERVAEVKVGGVNQLVIYNDFLIVGRQYPATNKYVKIYDKTDLIEIVAFEGISGDTYGITVDNDTVFVAVNGGWAGTTGSLVKIYVGNDEPEFIEEMALGEQAMGIAQLFNQNNIVYSVNKTPWVGTTGSFTEYHTLTGQVTSTTIDFKVGNGMNLVESELYVMLNGNIGAYNVDTKEITSTIVPDVNDSLDILSAVYDEISERFFVNFSGYFAEGEGKVYDLDGNEIDNYEVGISAEALALDYRLVGNVNESELTEINVKTFPNPFSEFISVESESKINSLSLNDISGKQITSISKVNSYRVKILADELSNGIYIININTDAGNVSKMIIKK